MSARIAIVGSPRAGKTTLARRISALVELPVVSSDDFAALGWSEASAEIARRMLEEPGIYEGVAVVRALRKLMQAIEGKPVDQVVVLSWPRMQLSAGQERMRRACETILDGIKPELLRRRVDLVYAHVTTPTNGRPG